MQLDEATLNVLATPDVGLDQLIRGIEKESLQSALMVRFLNNPTLRPWDLH